MRSLIRESQSNAYLCAARRSRSAFRESVAGVAALFDALAEAVRACGPAEVLSEKTRIAFHRRMSFLSVYPRKDHLILGFVLAKRIEHPRFESVQTFSPRNHLHNLRLRSISEIDEDVRRWIRDAYEVGEQRHLRR